MALKDYLIKPKEEYEQEQQMKKKIQQAQEEAYEEALREQEKAKTQEKIQRARERGRWKAKPKTERARLIGKKAIGKAKSLGSTLSDTVEPPDQPRGKQETTRERPRYSLGITDQMLGTPQKNKKQRKQKNQIGGGFTIDDMIPVRKPRKKATKKDMPSFSFEDMLPKKKKKKKNQNQGKGKQKSFLDLI